MGMIKQFLDLRYVKVPNLKWKQKLRSVLTARVTQNTVRAKGGAHACQYQSRTARGALNVVTVGDLAWPGHCQCKDLSLVFVLLVLVLDERKK